MLPLEPVCQHVLPQLVLMFLHATAMCLLDLLPVCLKHSGVSPLALQAARVFVVDLLMSAEGGGVTVLPCLAAALDAWPRAVPSRVDASGADASGESGAAANHVVALHLVLQQMCSDAAELGRCDGCHQPDVKLSQARPAS